MTYQPNTYSKSDTTGNVQNTFNNKVFAESITFVASSGAANVAEVAITIKDGQGSAIADNHVTEVWLSDDSAGTGLTGTTASGTVQVKTASGADFAALTAKKALVVQSLVTGIYTLEITDTAKTGFYVCAKCPGTGRTFVSTQLVTGDYGS